MVSFLSTIRTEIAKGFKGKLLQGSLRRETPGSLNSFGDPVTSPTTYPFEGIREDFNAAFAAAAGIPQTDVRILIIGGLIAVEPVADDLIFIKSKWHKVRRVLAIDPADASYQLQAYEIPAP